MDKEVELGSLEGEMATQHISQPQKRKGGLVTMPFIIANEALARVASLGLLPNMILYLMGTYRLHLAQATQILLWSHATSNFTPVVGAFIADSYLGRFLAVGLGSAITFLGMTLLWLTAMIPQARPPTCSSNKAGGCKSATGGQMAILISALALMSVGNGGLSCSLAFGADQVNRKDNPNNRRVLEIFFSWYYASAAISVIIALTGIVYIQDHLGWKVGYGVPAALMLLSTVSFLLASPLYVKNKVESSLFTGFVQVIVVAYKNRKLPLPPNNSPEHYHHKKDSDLVVPTDKLSFLNRACVIKDREQEIASDGSASNPWRLCTVDQVEELKAIIKVIPLWSTGIMMSVNIGGSFGLLQAKSLDRHITSHFQVPPGSFSVVMVLTIFLWIALYDRAILPLASKIRGNKNEVSMWREAFNKLGGVSGWPFNDSEEDTLIRLLVQRIMKELSNTPLGAPKFAVGLDERVEKLMKVLQVQSNGVKVLGLYGMGGVGKTTLAKALFNNLLNHFEHRCFISNVREVSSKQDGLVSLRTKIIEDLFPEPGSPTIISDHVKARENRVLLVLDDVDDVKQLDALIGKREWFYDGSRVIITTRDTVLIKNHVNELYEVEELNFDEALELFSNHALRRNKPPENFLNLSKKIVSLTGRMPLALEVFGSFLFDKRRVEEWEDAVEKLRQIRPKHLQDVLKISYDALDEEEKCIFLDMACLFVQMGMKRDDVIDVLRGCGFRGEIAITVLVQKCLIKITDEDNTLWMHDQIRDMGRQIVVDESIVDPGKRSRLWDRAEIMSVLKGHMGTRCIQGIVLDFEEDRFYRSKAESGFSTNLQWRSSLRNVLGGIIEQCLCLKNYLHPQAEENKEVILHTKSFEPMVNLRQLQINNRRLEGKFLPAELKWLQWQGCPLKHMPLKSWPRELAVLDLKNSKKIETLWGWNDYKVPRNLMVLNLSYCIELTAIPDLSGCRRLEKIDLENCINLTNIHDSIGSLSTLRSLKLTRCSSLINLPIDVSGLKQLESLFLSGCTKLKSLPENIGILKSLKALHADGTAITELPRSIFRLTKLERLVLEGCKHLRRLPSSIGHLCSLKELSLYQSGLEELPDSIGSLNNLERLNLMWCESLTVIPDSIGSLISLTQLFFNSTKIKELPSTIGSLYYLRELSVGNCKFLSKLPNSIKTLASVVELQLDGTTITDLPDEIGEMKLLRKLEMMNCKNLEYLPESIGHLAFLTTLNMFNGNIRELPESIGWLENLVTLRLNKCKMLSKLPASIGNLKSLYHFFMEETCVASLPESFGRLSSLRTLRIAKRPNLNTNENSFLAEPEENHNSFVLTPSFCNLTLLTELDARSWRISGKIPDEFEKLSQLETLKLGMNDFQKLPSSLKGLSILKVLSLPNCTQLISLPSLPSSLIELNVENCYALETIHDMSNLESLKELKLTNCVKVRDIPGLEGLKSLRRLYLSGCVACSSQIRKRLSKVVLKNLQNLSMPGGKLPEWFSGQTVCFSKPKNLELKGVIVGVVLSINHNINIGIPNMQREHMPGVLDVQANVLKQGKTLFSTVLNICGVPRTDEEHIHLCRFHDYHQLIAILKDGDTFCVSKRNPPFDKGLELKQCGVHLIFEGDDDYDGGEESLDKDLQSVSEKLANFFKTYEDESVRNQNELEMMGQEPRSFLVTLRSNFIFLFLIGLFFSLCYIYVLVLLRRDRYI